MRVKQKSKNATLWLTKQMYSYKYTITTSLQFDLFCWVLKSRIYMPTNIIREKSISLKLCVGIPRVFKVWTHAEIPTSKNYILKSYLRYLFQTPQLLLLSMQRPERFITSQRLFYIVSGKKDFFWLAWLLGLIWLNLYIKVILLIML